MEWIKGPTIGRGSSAIVSLATSSNSGEVFAVKSAELGSSAFLQREQHFLTQLNSPYVVKCMGFDITRENNKAMYNIFLEYLSGGTLSDVINRRGGSLDEPTIRFYTHQILQGLDHLHLNGLAHCDIKPQNILIANDGLNLKLADLGCARMVEHGTISTSAISGGTPVFMAPEVARGEEQGFPADVWALGCTVIEMATGNNPWPELNDPVSAIYKIGYSGDVPEFPSWLSNDAEEFLSKCLNRDAKVRWTVKQLLQHPFLTKIEPNFEQAAEFAKNSPTSVLDQGFWDSHNVSEPTQDQTGISFSANSPAERIRCFLGGSLPNWTEDEDWISVRSNHNEESLKLSQEDADMGCDNTNLIGTETIICPIVREHELESSIIREDLLDCPLEDICIMDCLCIGNDPVLFCNYVSRFLKFENNSYINSSFSIKVFPHAINFPPFYFHSGNASAADLNSRCLSNK